MRKTWENIVYHVVTVYVNDIINELQNKTKVSIPKPGYTEYVHLKHKHRVELINLQIARIIESIESNKVMLT